MDVQSILARAKEMLLEDGEHPPTLFVEYGQGGAFDILLFANFPFSTTLERKMALFSVGREQGIAHPGKRVVQACLVIEAWMSTAKTKEEIKHSPSQDPNRQEVLMVLTLDATDSSLPETIQRVEMVRDGSGKLVDLLQSREAIRSESVFLASFLAGYLSAFMSDDELAHKLSKHWK